MVAAVSATPNPKTSSQGGPIQNRPRPPLVPSEGDNVVVPPRRPKAREVTSRYMSPSTSISGSSTSSSRRCPSPVVSRTGSSMGQMTPMPGASVIKRSQSVERRRPATPRPGTPGNAGDVSSTAAKMLFTSTRSLSVSFQGESFSLKVSKAKPAPTPTPSVRKSTPERRRATPVRGGRGDVGGGADQGENSKPVDQHRWPARLRQPNSMTRSMDCTDERHKLGGSGNVVRALQKSMIDERSRTSSDARLQSDLGNVELEKSVECVNDANSVTGSVVPSDSAPSDADSVSSGSTSGAQESSGAVHGRGGPRGIVVPARFWAETNNRLRQWRSPADPGSPLAKSMGMKATAQPKLTAPKKFTDSPVSSPRSVASSRGLSSPLRSAVRPASPSKLAASSTSSPMRGMPSPTRTRNGVAAGTLGSNLSNMPSILSFAADVRRGKMGENRIDEAHLLRLLYNRLLQWRYVNARADASHSVQTMTAEKSLYNAWRTTSKLRDSVRDKRIMLNMMRQNLKLASILKRQMTCLEEWALMDRDHSSSLPGAIEALKASTLRLPIVGGARAEVQNLKDAICSAVDVMQGMASSICSLLLKVDAMNSLVCELANVAAKERASLDQCKDLLSTIAAMQVKDCSMRTHILQLNRIPSSLTTEM